MENDIDYIKKDLTEIKDDNKTGFKEVKELIHSHNENCDKRYANKWVEKIIIGILIALGGAVGVAAMTLF